MMVEEAKKLLPPELKYPLPDGVLDNLIDVQAIPLQFGLDEDGTGNGMYFSLMAALIELKEHRKQEKRLINIKNTAAYKKGYQEGYKEGYNSCIIDEAAGYTIDYMD